jgi:hypothetical protein
MLTGLNAEACQVDGECGIYPTLASAAKFLNTYVSGALLGLLGPVLSPVAALINSVTAIIDFVSDGDFIGAINEVVNIPANLVNVFLNGALLDLTPLLASLGENPPLDGVGFRLGGLISGPVPVNGSLGDPEDPPTEFSGGTGMDSLYAVKGSAVFPGLPLRSQTQYGTRARYCRSANAAAHHPRIVSVMTMYQCRGSCCAPNRGARTMSR